VQRITRYPLLIKQILQYTEPGQDRSLIERALYTAERILENINEAIREQESYDRLKVVSKDLWIGQGCMPLVWSVYTRSYHHTVQAAGFDSTNQAPRQPEIIERGPP
jgi:hypothetical protein